MGLIYHYCSMETFNKIIKNKTLRLSDITKSNDSQEKLWIYNNLEKAMENAFKSMHLTIKPQDSDGIGSYISTTKKELDEVIHQESLVVCFSKKGDLLSQWRGYANDGCGFAIGFDKMRLEEYLNRDERFEISPVEYDDEKQIRMLASDIRMAFWDYVEEMNLPIEFVPGLKGIEADYSPHQNIIYDDYDAISSNMVSYFDFSSCLMKSGDFREEDEVRIVFSSQFSSSMEAGYEVDTKIKGTTKLALGKIDYRVKDTKLVPFVEMDFSKAITDGIIKEVVIGPKADVRIEEMYTYLWHHGFEHIKVKKSNVSYV